MDFEKVAKALKSLGDPGRLKILELLPDSDECREVYNVTELSEELNVPQPTVSHHLNVLKNAGLVKCRKMCRDVYYWIDIENFEQTIKQLKNIIENHSS